METILRLLAENPESLGEVVKTYITKYKEPVYDLSLIHICGCMH